MNIKTNRSTPRLVVLFAAIAVPALALVGAASPSSGHPDEPPPPPWVNPDGSVEPLAADGTPHRLPIGHPADDMVLGDDHIIKCDACGMATIPQGTRILVPIMAEEIGGYESVEGASESGPSVSNRAEPRILPEPARTRTQWRRGDRVVSSELPAGSALELPNGTILEIPAGAALDISPATGPRRP